MPSLTAAILSQKWPDMFPPRVLHGQNHQQESRRVRAAAAAAAEGGPEPSRAEPGRPARIFGRLLQSRGNPCPPARPLCRRVIPPLTPQFAGVCCSEAQRRQIREGRAARRGKWAPVRTPLRRLTHQSHAPTEARTASPAAPAGALSGESPHRPPPPPHTAPAPPPAARRPSLSLRVLRRAPAASAAVQPSAAHTRSALGCARSRRAAFLRTPRRADASALTCARMEAEPHASLQKLRACC